MRHTTLSDEQREVATLYALCCLDGEEASAFVSHLDEGCAACEAEVESLRGVVDQLAIATPASKPSAKVRDKLLSRIHADGPHAMPFSFVLDEDKDWIQVSPGVSTKTFFTGAHSKTYLMRCDPGARVPIHRHHAVEHVYMVSGDVHVAGRHLHAGDYHVAMPGSTHDDAYTDDGCMFFIVEVAQLQGGVPP